MVKLETIPVLLFEQCLLLKRLRDVCSEEVEKYMLLLLVVAGWGGGWLVICVCGVSIPKEA